MQTSFLGGPDTIILLAVYSFVVYKYEDFSTRLLSKLGQEPNIKLQQIISEYKCIANLKHVSTIIQKNYSTPMVHAANTYRKQHRFHEIQPIQRRYTSTQLSRQEPNECRLVIHEASWHASMLKVPLPDSTSVLISGLSSCLQFDTASDITTVTNQLWRFGGSPTRDRTPHTATGACG